MMKLEMLFLDKKNFVKKISKKISLKKNLKNFWVIASKIMLIKSKLII